MELDEIDDLDAVRDDLIKVASLLRQNIERLDRDMNSGLADSKGAGANDKHVKHAKELSLAVAQLGKEIRQWKKRQVDKAKSLTKKQKTDIIVRFAAELPPPERKKLISIMLDMP